MLVRMLHRDAAACVRTHMRRPARLPARLVDLVLPFCSQCKEQQANSSLPILG